MFVSNVSIYLSHIWSKYTHRDVLLTTVKCISCIPKCLACGVRKCYKSLIKLKPNSESVFYKINNLKVQQRVGRFSAITSTRENRGWFYEPIQSSRIIQKRRPSVLHCNDYFKFWPCRKSPKSISKNLRCPPIVQSFSFFIINL